MLKLRLNITIRSTLRNIVLLCLFLALSSTVALCQETPNPQRGFYPGGSYAVSDIESINTVNGNLTFRIPLASLPPGRGGLTAGVNLTYNSKLWDTNLAGRTDSEDNYVHFTQLVESQEGGWHYDFEYVLKDLVRPEYLSYECGTPESQNIHKLQIRFPDGSLHEFAPLGFSGSHGYYKIYRNGYMWGCDYNPPYVLYTTSTMTYYSTDGTFLRLDVEHASSSTPTINPWTLYFPDGHRVTGGNGPERIIDRNGNYIEIQHITYSSNPAEKIIDQFGRYILIEHASTATYIHQTGANGTALTTTVTGTSISTNTVSYYVGGIDNHWEYLPATTGVSQITLPSEAGGLSYNFSYTPTSGSTWFGEVSSITLPSGAEASYKYAVDGMGSGYNIQQNRVSQKDLTYDSEYDGSTSSVTDTWLYGLHTITGSCGIYGCGVYLEITGPDGGVTRQSFRSPESGAPDAGLVYKTEQPDGSVIEQIWAQNKPYNVSTGVDGTVNPYVKTEYRSIKNASGSLEKTAIKDFTADKNGNVTQVAEYDWVPWGNVTRTSGMPSGTGGATLLRTTVNTYFSPTPDASNTTTDDSDVYHKSTSQSLRNAIESSEVWSPSLALSRTEFVYDSSTTTGNLTQQISWDSTKGSISRPLTSSNWVRVLNTYDSYGHGNVLSTMDARGNAVNFTYDSNNLYVIQIDAAASTSVQQTTTLVHDFNSGLVTNATTVDPNSSGNNLTTDTTYDALGRPIGLIVADGKSEKRCEATVYSDTDRRMIARRDLSAAGDGKLVIIQHYDQLGRVRLARKLESTTANSTSICTSPAFSVSADYANDETVGIKSQTRYFAGDSTYPNSYTLTSNPYTGASSSATTNGTTGWTRGKTDQSGRSVETQTFSGTGLPAPWGSNTSSTGAIATTYDGSSSTVTDQAGKVRRSIVDGLGRLIEVDEPNSSGSLGTLGSPNQATYYTYNAINNQTQATQDGQTRTFNYSSLGRLTQAVNPESGTISYVYDNDGNLTSKIDPRIVSGTTHVTTTMTYDELNRITTKSYNDSLTPGVYYHYDSQTLPSGAPSYTHGASYGRLLAVTYGTSTSAEGDYYGYDLLGEVLTKVQRTDSTNYTTTATYNKAGSSVSNVYPSPSGRTVIRDFDDAGRISKIHGPSNSPYYAGSSGTVIQYTASGSLLKQTLGNGLIHSIVYNSRLQPTEIDLGTSTTAGSALALTYIYGSTTTNNGNITAATISAGSQTINQDFSYDELNRLSMAEETNGANTVWQQNFGYDRYGNRAIMTGSGGGGGSATSGTGTVSISGSEQSDTYQVQDYCQLYGDEGCLQWHYSWETIYDSGTVSITVNGVTSSVSYNSSSTATSIATALTTALNAGSTVTATRSGTTITLTSIATGTSSNYTLSSSSTYDSYFGGPSFVGTPSGSTLTGGTGSGGGGGSSSPDLTFNTSNRITNSGYTYDAAGNLSADGTHTYAYDAENHLISTDSGANPYTYDGEGHRVKKSSGSLRLIYGIGGRLLIECDSSTGSLKKEYVYGVSGLLATVDSTNGTLYMTADHLGSLRLVTNSSGALYSKHDYMPFGEEILAGTGTYPYNVRSTSSTMQYLASAQSDGIRQQFTSKERDAESGLDFFEARYYASRQGRFTSPDPLLSIADIMFPQSLNRYSYVMNNPLAYIDPSGLIWLKSNGDDPIYKWVDDDEYKNNKDSYKDWTEVETGTVIYLGRTSGDYNKFSHLIGGYVSLEDGGDIVGADDPNDPTSTEIGGGGQEPSVNRQNTLPFPITWPKPIPIPVPPRVLPVVVGVGLVFWGLQDANLYPRHWPNTGPNPQHLPCQTSCTAGSLAFPKPIPIPFPLLRKSDSSDRMQNCLNALKACEIWADEDESKVWACARAYRQCTETDKWVTFPDGSWVR